MRLKSIKLVGFKSFVDSTRVEFKGNLTAIVGPNGCGKSNIIDAVRWVMGESSAKYLRGESMTDVIFNGSNARKPVGRAAIELNFDNSDGTVGGHLASYAEIAIKREVSREGQSTYFLNGTRCRRKDITDIFLGTGLGPRSYAIIEQGMISRLIEAKPEELRVYIEEAAGISRYKERRRETENRMRRTRMNLERLTDIREEMGRQLGRLERQAKAAEKYTRFKQEERTLKAKLAYSRYDDMQNKVEKVSQHIAEYETKQEAVLAVIREYEAKIEALRQQHQDSLSHQETVQANFYQLGSEITQLEQQMAFAKQRSEQLTAAIEKNKRALDDATERHLAEQAKYDALQLEQQQGQPEYERISAEVEALAATLQSVKDEAKSAQAAWEQSNHACSEATKQAEVSRSVISHLEKSQLRMHERLQRLNTKQHSDELTEKPRQIVDDLMQMASELTLKEQQQKANVSTLQTTLETQRKQLQQVITQQNEHRTQLQKTHAEVSTLTTLQKAATKEHKGLKKWLEDNALTHNKRLLEQLQVDTGWDRAVEIVLASYLQAVEVKSIDDYQQVLKNAPVSVTLYQQAERNNATTAANSLLSKVRNADAFSACLASVIVAESLADAMQQRASLPDNASLITQDGVWLGKHWLRVAQDETVQTGVLQRQEAVKQRRAQLTALQATVDSEQEAVTKAQENVRSLEQELTAAQQHSAVLVREYNDVQLKLKGENMRLEQRETRLQQLAQERQECERQQQEEREQLERAQQDLAAAIELMDTLQHKQKSAFVQREACIEKLDHNRQQLQAKRENVHTQKMAQQSLAITLQALQTAMQRTTEEVASLEKTRNELYASNNEDTLPVENGEQLLATLLADKVKAEAALGLARNRVADIDNQQRELDKKRQHTERDLATLRRNLEKERILRENLVTSSQNFTLQLSELEVSVDEAKASIDQNRGETIDEEQVVTALSELSTKITNLGAINLAAIEEYEQQRERKSYLDAQDADLSKALALLETAIRKIDKETRSRFKETYEKVNTSVQELFPKIFGGGHAYLELTGEDLLSTGVAIMARPPGKRNSTIHLLSGGEKALTALALVFSIFRLNPAPFCLLDEVDAPLDDVNVGRFCKLVKEMSASVQFIYITHNKIAMEMAETLMGVTMQEAGVSRLVSVDVDEAMELVI